MKQTGLMLLITESLSSNATATHITCDRFGQQGTKWASNAPKVPAANKAVWPRTNLPRQRTEPAPMEQARFTSAVKPAGLVTGGRHRGLVLLYYIYIAIGQDSLPIQNAKGPAFAGPSIADVIGKLEEESSSELAGEG